MKKVEDYSGSILDALRSEIIDVMRYAGENGDPKIRDEARYLMGWIGDEEWCKDSSEILDEPCHELCLVVMDAEIARSCGIESPSLEQCLMLFHVVFWEAVEEVVDNAGG